MTKGAHGQEISLPADYAGNPIIRGLVQLIPAGIGSALDVLIVDKAERMKKERVRTFFDELGRGDVALTEELVQSDDFLHSLDATMRAAFRTRREEKVRMFARLLKRGAIDGQAASLDDYEEMVGLLDELSYREWQALLLFQGFLDRATGNLTPMQRAVLNWSQFVAELRNQLGVDHSEASSFMNRISRTGLYNEIIDSAPGYQGGVGMTTPRFARFRRLVEDLDAPADGAAAI